jgi:hypothetical protein
MDLSDRPLWTQQADLVNAGKPETLAGVHGQTHRQTAACMYVTVGETAGCDFLICIHYGILIGATTWWHMKPLKRGVWLLLCRGILDNCLPRS